MKQLIAYFLAGLLFSACSSSSEQIYLQRANCSVGVSIFKDAEGYKLGMVFENKSRGAIRLQNPECLNQSVMVNVRSSSGEQMLQQSSVNSGSCGELVTLEPGASRTFVLPYALDALYGLKAEGKYKVYFEYIGGFYEENGILSDEEVLKSPAAEFAVN
jgi:hypothetical protein